MDHNLNLLKNPLFDLPRTRTNPDFLDFLINTFKEYKSLVYSFEGSLGKQICERKNGIEYLCDALLNSLKLYYEGFPSRSFGTFSDGMKVVNEWLWKEKREFSAGNSNYAFRGRLPESGSRLFKNEMFHIPFESRHLITTKRYSIPGYPCLYLSSSIYGCWIECGRPEFEVMQFSRFDLNKYRFLELSMTPKVQAFLHERLLKDKQESLIENFTLFVLTAWPLIAVCSTKQMNFGQSKAKFIAEYIFPQMLMEWIRQSEDLDGVRYFSVQSEGEAGTWQEFVNYAIPVKKVQEKGHCPQLVYDLPYSAPLSYKDLLEEDVHNALEDFAGDKKKTLERIVASRGIHFLANFYPYIATRYGRLEFALSKMPHEQLK